MRDLLVSMLSAAERREPREVTLRNMASVGLRPAVSLNTPTLLNAEIAEAERKHLEALGVEVWITGDPNYGYGGRNNCLGGKAPVLTALERGADLLYCEDDIDFANDFPWFLQLAREAEDAATWFYSHDGRGDKLLGARYGIHVWTELKRAIRYKEPFYPRGLYRIRDAAKLNSGQCIYVPHAVLARLPIKDLGVSEEAMDMWLQDRLCRIAPLLVALPHPVQHRHDRTGRTPSSNPNKTSQSYPLRR